MSRSDLVDILAGFISNDRWNLIPGTSIRIFEPPLVGVARADDPMFEKLQDDSVVGRDHRLPNDWLEDAQSVVSFFAPFTEEVRESNRQGKAPSEEWVYSRFYGQPLMTRLSVVLKEKLKRGGHRAVVPQEADGYSVRDMNSNWSERHVAHVAGLGTFGLNTALITERGTAGRLGSVVTTAEVDASRRPYSGAFEYCPWFSGGRCNQCVERCPGGALSPEGKDRVRCSRYLRDINGPAVRARYGFPYSPCGKCYVDVPCEAKRPSRGWRAG